jgi:hypothetical protein
VQTRTATRCLMERPRTGNVAADARNVTLDR